MVEVIIPPTMGAAMGFTKSEPISDSRRIDTRLVKTAHTVISFGRKRWTAYACSDADSDVYVIYTAGQSFASLVTTNPPEFYQNRLAIKFTYSWRP
jgi:hypothetical protein